MAVRRPIALSLLGAGSELQLVRLAIELGATEVGGPLSELEERLTREALQVPGIPVDFLEWCSQEILAGRDPLGAALCELRPPATRRDMGAFYTPPELVRPMTRWVLDCAPNRIVDAGCGSGRFTLESSSRDRDAQIVAVDIDPLATLLTRAAVAVFGYDNVRVLQEDYTTVQLPSTSGRTAFIGNPPYVRHHGLSPSAKAWAKEAAAQQGLTISSLAGLHAHFYLATSLHSKRGDIGCFVTSSEWLDVGYGSVIRHLLLDKLGGQSLHILAPTAVAFTDAMATSAVACFEVGTRPESIRFALVQRLDELTDLRDGKAVWRSVLAKASRWSPLVRSREVELVHDMVPLSGIARVHRGVVTGANDFFVMPRDRADALGIARWCRPAITRAQEILSANGVVRDTPDRRVVLDVPGDVDRSAHPSLDAYLQFGEQQHNGKHPVSEGYICRHRRPWWRLGAPPAPPIVVSYMARQAPAFALNPDGLIPINIAHGIYPKLPLGDAQLAAFAAVLNGARTSFKGSGRTYHGGMEKFEPREVEALMIPRDGISAL